MKSAAESKVFSTNPVMNVAGTLVDLATPRVMGVINVTPDSFYQGSRVTAEKALLDKAAQHLDDGAMFLDVGAYSTRPGADEIPVDEETKRIAPAIRAIVKNFPTAMVSVDTFRSAVARVAVDEGARLINDVSGGTLDLAMFETVATLGVPYILMHMRGNPATMTQMTDYENLVTDITADLQKKIVALQALGVKDIVVDPGFGFAKTVSQNFELLHHLDHLALLQKPLLVGLSRKSMIWRTLSITADDALNGTTVLNTIALLKGANILRVHDVKEAMQAIQLLSKLPGA